MISNDILDFARDRELARTWLSLVAAYQEALQASRQVVALGQAISSSDRLNVFTDTRDEALEKDWKERLSHHQVEMKHYGGETTRLLQELAAQVPAFAVTMRLEQMLQRAYHLTSPKEAHALGLEVEAWADSLQTQSPQLGPLPASAHACRRLAAALSLVAEGRERRWGEAISFLVARPLVLRLLHLCRLTAEQEIPGIPLPCALLKQLRPAVEVVDKPLDVFEKTDKGQIQELFSELERLCEQLAEARRTLRSVKSEISVLDRVNVFTDTPAEAKAKASKAEGAALVASLEDGLTRLSQANLALRGRVWPTFLLDRGPDIDGMVMAIRASKPSGLFTRTSEVLNREPAVAAVEAFRASLQARYPSMPRLEQLKGYARSYGTEDVPEVEAIPELPMPPNPDPIQLGHLLTRELAGQYKLAQERFEEAQRRYQQAHFESPGKPTGFLDALSAMFNSDPKTGAKMALEQAQAEMEEALVLSVWRVFAPSALHHLLDQLMHQLAALEAEVHSREVRTDRDSTRTEYYSILVGQEKARATSSLLYRLLRDSASEAPFPSQSLESFSDNLTCQEIREQPLAF